MKKIGMYLFSGQCKNFNDWFSSTQLSLKDCFDSSETKTILEERLQRLKVKYKNVHILKLFVLEVLLFYTEVCSWE